MVGTVLFVNELTYFVFYYYIGQSCMLDHNKNCNTIGLYQLLVTVRGCLYNMISGGVIVQLIVMIILLQE